MCDEPTADVPDVDQAARTQSITGMDEEQALIELLPTLDGYVTSWVSDGGPTFNVLVTGDPATARRAMREVFSGPLCVEQRDLPTEQDVRAAQDTLSDGAQEIGFRTVGSGVSGLLRVEVILADQETVDRIHEVVEQGLTPDQVVITGLLRPLNPGDE